jgi:alkylation response protein AidB-like acyl-CoA dehydrogenase
MHTLDVYLKTGWKEETISEMEAFAETYASELDACVRAARFPKDLYLEMGGRRWVGPVTPVEYGGLGGGVAEYCLIEEEVGRLGLVSPQISIQGQLWINLWGSAGQKARYLKGLACGELIFCEAISEPGVGSSLKLMKAIARRSEGDWILDGCKTHVNLGHQSDVMVFYAMTEDGLTSFLVDTHQPGITTRQTDPVGLRLIPTSDILFESVRVPNSALLGNPGEGMKTFLSTFNISRLGNASELIGFGRRALGLGIRYAQNRQIDEEHHVTDFQGIQWIVAEAYSGLYHASLARDRAARLADQNKEHAFETSLAKKAAINAAEYSANEVFALIGGFGLYEDTPFRQIMCDIKTLRVAGGSLEILQNYIARRILKAERYEGLA